MIGVADLINHRCEFLMGLLLSLRAHPIDRVDVSPQRRFNVFYHFLDARFAFRRKITRSIGLPQRLAYLVVFGFHTSAPQRLDLLCAMQSLPVELKMRIHEVSAQSARLAIQ